MSAAPTKHQPKVLIVSAEPFNQERGTGITLTNLFAGWEPQNLATLYWLDVTPSCTSCAKHWKLPSRLVPRGLRLASAAAEGGSAQRKPCSVETGAIVTRRGSAGLKQLLLHWDRSLGFSQLLYRVKLSPKVLREIRAFGPDVIYSPVSSQESMGLLHRIHNALHLPMVVHVFDDWISHKPRDLVGWAMRFRERRHFCSLLRAAQARLAIGPDMAASYEQRYKLSFKPLQNPVDSAVWDLPPHPDPTAGAAYVLRFTGNLYQPGNVAGLVEFAEAFETVPSADRELRFEIYAPLEVVKLYAPKFARCGRTTLQPVPTDTASMVQLYTDAHGLVIALDSAELDGGLLALSMPTKVPSTLMSGRALLIYAPRRAAVASFVRRHDAGCVIDAPIPKAQLAQGIGNFLFNGERRRAWAAAGKQVAIEQFSKTRVCPMFARMLKQAAENELAGPAIHGYRA